MGEMTREIFESFSHTPIGEKIEANLLWIMRCAKGGIVIFLSRKGYWLYQVYRRYAGWSDEILQCVIVYSDRYIKKCVDNDLSGRPVYIVDDTVTTGISMFDVYMMVKKLYTRSEVRCIALFMRMSKQELYELMEVRRPEEPHDNFEDFLAHLHTIEKISLEQIGWLSYEQIHLFQSLLIPYVVDLPIITDNEYRYAETVTDNNHHYSVFSNNAFKNLMQMTGDWQYEDNSYRWNDLLGKKIKSENIHCGFFRYSDPNIYTRMKNIILLMVVKCRYEWNEEGMWNVVFTPFAIVNSMSFNNALDLCMKLYAGTAFGKWLNGREINSDYYTLLLRTIVYFFSLYAWSSFRNEAEEWLEEELPMKLNWEMMPENSSDVFISTATDMGRWKKEAFLQRIQGISGIYGSPLSRYKAETTIKKDDVKNAYILLYQNIIKRKRENIADAFVSIEELYQIIDSALDDREENKKILFVKVLLQMLDQSVLGNAVTYQKSLDMIRRGFRFGENSDIALPFYNSYIYYGVESLYSRCLWKAGYDMEVTKSLFFDKIHSLFRGIRNMAVKSGYLGVLFSDDDLKYNEMYFTNNGIEEADLRVLIENKKFRINADERFHAIEKDIDFCVDELIEL